MRMIDKFLIATTLIVFGVPAIEVACLCFTGKTVEATVAQAYGHDANSDTAPHFDTPHQARLAAMAHIQTYSDYIGFEGQFSVIEGDTVLHMDGSPLCADDFDVSVPPEAWLPVKTAGFKYFECDYKDTHVKIEVW